MAAGTGNDPRGFSVPAAGDLQPGGLYCCCGGYSPTHHSFRGITPCVITSYSIHYTKLYDPAIFLLVLGMTVRYTHALLRHSEEMHLGKKSRTACRTNVATEQAWVGSRIARSWERNLHRITSYNICYTKLLRARMVTHEQEPNPSGYFSVEASPHQ